MKTVFLKLMYPAIIFTALCIVVFACNKKFDVPPQYTPPVLTPTLTIAQLKAKHVTGSTETISTDDIIEGTVVANDSSGNFYKQIIIEDSSAGIAIGIDDYNLYTSYPVGRVVYIKLKGLIMYDYNKLTEIGGTQDATGSITGISSPLKDTYVIKGIYGAPLSPKVVSVSDLNDSYQNMLIQLSNFEFAEADTAKLFADTSSSKKSLNYVITSCSNETITLRSSGYASFAGISLPNGNGSITAIYSVYGTTKQLYVRDTADVQFNGTRCNSGPAVQTTIANIRSLYKSSDIKLGAYKIGGVVISDAAGKNISTGSVILQDGNAGISVYFGGTITYNLGDSIVLDVTGDSLQNFNGSLEIKTTYGTAQPAPVATNITVVPRTFSIASINTNISTIEYTLLKVVNAKASGNAIYSGSNTLADASGSISLYTSSSASFAGSSLPADTSDWVGFAKAFGSSKEFLIRNTADVTATTTVPVNPGGGISLTTSPFTINFDDLSTGLPAGVLVKLSSSATSLGTDGTYGFSPASWSSTSSGFKNYAGAAGLDSSSDATAQSASANRALGIKQTSATGYDPGAAVVFEIDNTTGKTNFTFSFLLQTLAAEGRTTTWQVDYATGDNPSSFTPVTTSPAVLTTGPTFASTPVTVSFGSALDNKSSKVWIRIVTLSATTGSGSRASTGIDDVNIGWQ